MNKICKRLKQSLRNLDYGSFFTIKNEVQIKNS